VLQTSPTLQSGLAPLFSGGGEVPPSGLYTLLSKSTDQEVPLDCAGDHQCPHPALVPGAQQGGGPHRTLLQTPKAQPMLQEYQGGPSPGTWLLEARQEVEEVQTFSWTLGNIRQLLG